MAKDEVNKGGLSIPQSGLCGERKLVKSQRSDENENSINKLSQT